LEVGNVIGIIVVVLFFLFIVLFIFAKSLNSIHKSVQKMQGKDRCVACKRRLKAVDGVYAQTCSKCGANQPTDFERAMAKAKRLTLQTGEYGLFSEGPVLGIGGMKIGQEKGRLVLTNRRLHFESKRGQVRDWPLEDVAKVGGLTNAAGFAIDNDRGEKTVFVGGTNPEWHDKVLAAANEATIKQLRSKKRDAVAPQVAAPNGAAPQAVSPTPPMPPPAAATPVPPPPGTPAGWLTDPVGNYEHRYWDGSKWTEHVAAAGQQMTSAL
jgi:predicted RNA-binding Zn-ribbon protein involved in translation (DUF1610 family)